MAKLNSPRSSHSLRVAASVALAFAGLSWSSGVSTAATILLCFAAGYATEFYFFRCASALLHRQSLSGWHIALALSGLAADVVFIYFGLGMLLVLAIGVWLLVDLAVILGSRS
jgi:hypothetical protein